MTIFILSACALFTDQNEQMQELSSDRLYQIAQEAMQKGDYAKCAQYFVAFERRDPFSAHAPQAQINVPYCYYKDNNHKDAILAANRFLHLHPEHADADYVYYLKGLIYSHSGNQWMQRLARQDLSERDPQKIRDAYDSFHRLLTLFPKSPYAAEARERAQYALYMLAKHELSVGRYYYEFGAYLAALNRAQTVVSHFSQTNTAKEALVLMIQSYQKLNLPELAEDTRRVLQQNDPQRLFTEYWPADQKNSAVLHSAPKS